MQFIITSFVILVIYTLYALNNHVRCLDRIILEIREKTNNEIDRLEEIQTNLKIKIDYLQADLRRLKDEVDYIS